jgi:UDP-glucuronate 4-epimerase
MAMMIFLDKITKGETIDVYNYGKMQRDFTYIDDIIDGVVLALDASFSYEIMNLGNDSPVELEYMISLLEKNLEKQAIKNYMEIQPGDVLATWADIDHTKDLL